MPMMPFVDKKKRIDSVLISILIDFLTGRGTAQDGTGRKAKGKEKQHLQWPAKKSEFVKFCYCWNVYLFYGMFISFCFTRFLDLPRSLRWIRELRKNTLREGKRRKGITPFFTITIEPFIFPFFLKRYTPECMERFDGVYEKCYSFHVTITAGLHPIWCCTVAFNLAKASDTPRPCVTDNPRIKGDGLKKKRVVNAIAWLYIARQFWCESWRVFGFYLLYAFSAVHCLCFFFSFSPPLSLSVSLASSFVLLMQRTSISASSRFRVTTYLMHIRVLVTELEEQREITVYICRVLCCCHQNRPGDVVVVPPTISHPVQISLQ